MVCGFVKLAQVNLSFLLQHYIYIYIYFFIFDIRLLGLELYNFFAFFFLRVVSVSYPGSCFSKFNPICLGLSSHEYLFLELEKIWLSLWRSTGHLSSSWLSPNCQATPLLSPSLLLSFSFYFSLTHICSLSLSLSLLPYFLSPLFSHTFVLACTRHTSIYFYSKNINVASSSAYQIFLCRIDNNFSR
jgi:hypothetical protein